jgi:RNA recognition motif-containing protein
MRISMTKRIYVGNLPYSATSEELGSSFAQYGNVLSSRIVIDRETGRSKGFAFVEMDADEEADAAIQALNGADYAGRTIVVNEARPREDRGFGGGNGGGYGNREGGMRGGFGGGGRPGYGRR